MLLPAVCDNCGKFFTPRAINAENVQNLTISNVRVGPCPKCGGMGHIPDGVYNVMGDVLQVLSAPARSIEELQRLGNILREAYARSEDADTLRGRIRKESPALSAIADLLPANRTERIAYIALLIAAIGVIGDHVRSGEKPSNVTVNQVINNITIEAPKDPASKKAKPATKSASTGGVNYRKEKRRTKKADRQRRQ